MAFFKKKNPNTVEEPMDLESVMKKYDQESNVRIWEGKARLAVNCVLASFSLFCIYVTLFTSWLEEHRLTSFMACIIFMGFLVFPAQKGHQKVNHMPWYDIAGMIIGTGAFLYFNIFAMDIIQQGSMFAWYQIIIGIIGILALAEVCRRSVGLPILIVAAFFIVYALVWGLSNPSLWGKLNYTVRYLFYSKEGILSTPVNVCSSSSVPSWSVPALLTSSFRSPTLSSAASPAVLQRLLLWPPPWKVWFPVPPLPTPLVPVPSPFL